MPFSRLRWPLFLACGALLAPVCARALPAQTSVSAGPTLELGGWTYALADEPLEARWSVRARQGSAKNGEARLVFGFKDARNFALLRVTASQLELWSVSEGKARKLGQSQNGGGELSLQIAGHRIRVLQGDAIAIAATLKLPGQNFGGATRNFRWELGDVQPTEPVVFRDDFMRTQGPDDAEVPSQWQNTGSWKTSGALGPKSDAALNPNPFVFRAASRNGAPAIARAGRWFWSDYAVTASVRATRAPASGLREIAAGEAPLTATLEAFGGDANSGVRGEIDFAAHVARLKVGDKVLAQSAPFDTQAGQWHRVRLEPGPGTARLFIDGVERVRADNVKLAQGQISLRAQTGGAAYVDFDDVRVGPLSDKKGWGEGSLPERFQKDRLMKNWASAASAWKRDATGTWWHTGDFFGAATISLPLPELAEGAGMRIVMGAQPHDAANASARIEVTRAGQNMRFATNFERAAVAIPSKTVPLAQARGAMLTVTRDPGTQSRTGSLKLALNGRAFPGPSWIPPGTVGPKIGIVPLRNGAPLPPPVPREVEVSSATFERDGRAVVGVNITPVTPEIAREVGLPQPYGAIVDNMDANAPARAAGVQIGDVVVGANGQRVTDVESMRVAVGAVKPGQNVSLTLLRAPRDGSGLDWEQVSAQTPALLDYSFTSAPTDWRAARGRWEVAERWTCSPQWSFFSGRNSDAPLLWSRFQTKGDWTLEAYLATPMDLARGERSPADLNVTVGGDGRDLASGYSFGFATDRRAKNTIWRGDQIALQKDFEMPPGAGETHQDWFYIRLEKRRIAGGVRFKWSVNGREVATYLDPNPLADGGHLAFWSLNGGLSIARVRLWNAGITTANEQGWAPAPPVQTIANVLGTWSARGAGEELSARIVPVGLPAKISNPTPQAAAALFKNAAAQKAGTLQIVNPQSGGDWTTYVTRQSFSPQLHPTLAWDYRMNDDVKLNLYARIEGEWREIIWSGGASQQGNKGLGTIPFQADGQWHRASFDLLAALRERGLGEKSVEALAFAAPGSGYLRAGLGGNHRGANWELRDFAAPVLVAKTG